MRTIKFRAWDEINNEMVYEKYGSFFGNYLPSHEILRRYENVMQFTGLHDKNGKEIYEGDLVSFEDDPADCVYWDYDYSCWAFKTTNQLSIDEFYDWCTLRKEHEKYYIIQGNVFENPELLKAVSSKK